MQALKHRIEGNKFYLKQEYKSALNNYLRAIQASPNDLHVHCNLVATFVQLEMYTQAASPPPPPPPPLYGNTLHPRQQCLGRPLR
jgi:hypothetical protein